MPANVGPSDADRYGWPGPPEPELIADATRIARHIARAQPSVVALLPLDGKQALEGRLAPVLLRLAEALLNFTEESVAILLSLHDLHPQDAAARVRAAIDAVAPRFLDEGVAVELVSVDGERVRIALKAAGTVRAHVAGLRGELERVVRRSAPEIVAVDIDGLEASDVPAGRITVGPPKK